MDTSYYVYTMTTYGSLFLFLSELTIRVFYAVAGISVVLYPLMLLYTL